MPVGYANGPLEARGVAGYVPVTCAAAMDAETARATR